MEALQQGQGRAEARASLELMGGMIGSMIGKATGNAIGSTKGSTTGSAIGSTIGATGRTKGKQAAATAWAWYVWLRSACLISPQCKTLWRLLVARSSLYVGFRCCCCWLLCCLLLLLPYCANSYHRKTSVLLAP